MHDKLYGTQYANFIYFQKITVSSLNAKTEEKLEISVKHTIS